MSLLQKKEREMKAKEKNYNHLGNLALVQFSSLEGEGFPFLPGGPALGSGRLVIREVSDGGVVGQLLAINHTDDYYMLGDGDILKGARQNRSLHVSVLIAPRTKCLLDVSCVERGRWRYTSPDFRMSPRHADPDIRFSKIREVSETRKNPDAGEGLQRNIWNKVGERFKMKGMTDNTENYENFLEEEQRARKFDPDSIPVHQPANGMAVFRDHRLVCVESFGNRQVYAYYFPRLLESVSFLAGAPGGAIGEAEAFYRLDEFTDRDLFSKTEMSDPLSGAGTIRWLEEKDARGFELVHERGLVHQLVFLPEE